MTVSEHYLFRNDEAALDEFLLHGRELKSTGLENFQQMLQSLPKLREADIVVHDKIEETDVPWEELSPTLRQAFTGKRRFKLLMAAKVLLQATRLHLPTGRVTVKHRRFPDEDEDTE
jgi:hypothetical protein